MAFAEANPFLHAPSRVLDRYIDSPPPDQDAPDTYRFAQRGKLRDILLNAGTLHPTERLVEFKMRLPMSPQQVWTLRSEMSETLRGKMARLSKEQLAEATGQIVEDFSKYSTQGAMSFPAEVLILSGSAH